MSQKKLLVQKDKEEVLKILKIGFCTFTKLENELLHSVTSNYMNKSKKNNV